MKLIKAHFVNKTKLIKCSETFSYAPYAYDVLCLEYDIGWLMINVTRNPPHPGDFQRCWYSYSTSFDTDGNLYCCSDNDEKILALIKAVPPLDLLDGLLINNKVAIYLRDIGVINGGGK
jgi:hypothetical protein